MSAGNYYNQRQGEYNALPSDPNAPGPVYPPTSGYPPTANYQQQPPPQQYYQSAPSNPYYAQGLPPQNYQGGPPPPGQGGYQQYYELPYQRQYPSQGPPYQQPGPRAPTASGWGSGTPDYNGQHAIQSPPSHSVAYGTAAGAATGAGATSTKGMSSKFGKKLKLSRKDSSSSSSSSDSDSGGKKHKNGKFATLPPQMGHGPYPFSFLCSQENSEMISLKLVSPSGNDPDNYYLVGPQQGASHAMYRMQLKGERWKDYEIYRAPLPSLDIKKAEWVSRCGWEHSSTENQLYKFPWLKWDCSLTGMHWGSDVDLLQGKAWMKWCKITMESGNGMCVRCFDTTHPKMPTVASFYLPSYDSGELEIPARIVQTLEQLDELVTISWSAIVFHREP